MDGCHPCDQDANNLSDQNASNLLDAQNFEAELEPLQPEDLGDSPEGGNFPNDGWQQQVPGNVDDSSQSDIDDDLIQEDEGEDDGDVLVGNGGNEQSLPVVPLIAPPAAPAAAPPAGNAPNPPPVGAQGALTQLWCFQNSENQLIDHARLGITATPSVQLQPLARAINAAGEAALAAAAKGPSNMSNPPATGTNTSTGSSRTLLPAASANPPAGPSNTPSPSASGTTTPCRRRTGRFASAFDNPPAGPSNTSSPSASCTSTPTGRTSRLSDVFNNPLARPDSTPISTDFLNQPRTGFLNNSPMGSSTTVNALGAIGTPRPATVNNPPAGPSTTPNPPSVTPNLPTITATPLAGPSTTPSTAAGSSANPVIDHPAAREQIRIDLTSATRTTDRIQTEMQDLGGRLTTLEASINLLTSSFQGQQTVLLPALAQFARAANDQQTFTRAVLTGQEIRQRWQRNVDRSLGQIAAERQRTNDRLEFIVADQTDIMGHFQHWDNRHGMHQDNLEDLSRAQQHIENDVHNIHVHLGRFVTGWDVNRSVTEENQRLILSHVSWLEPYFIFFHNLGAILSFFFFWRRGRPGGGGPPWPPHGGPPGGLPPPGGGQVGGVDVGVGGDGGGGQGGDQQNGGQQRGQQAAGNQAGAQPTSSQVGSNLRSDGLPYQPYRPLGHPEHTPIIPLFSAGQAGRPTSRCPNCWKCLLYFILIVMVLASFVKEFWPHLYAASSFTRQPVASAGYTKAAPPGRGAWLDEHVMEALFGAQQEAQTVSALAAQSAEIVVACAKFVENGNGRKEELKQYWYGKPTKDTEGACRKAVRLAAESAEKMKGLAVRLEWVLGEKWWATLTSTERGMWTKTSIGEGAKTSTGESVADGTATATKMATETLTAWW